MTKNHVIPSRSQSGKQALSSGGKEYIDAYVLVATNVVPPLAAVKPLVMLAVQAPAPTISVENQVSKSITQAGKRCQVKQNDSGDRATGQEPGHISRKAEAEPKGSIGQ